MKPSHLRILEAVEALGGEAPMLAIYNHLGGRGALVSLYSAVNDLEKQGYVRCYSGPGTPERGGRPTRVVRLAVSLDSVRKDQK